MRIGLVCAVLLASAFTGWGQPAKEGKAETIARWHFIGTKQLSEKKDLPVLREIIALPATRELRDLALQAFSRRVAERFTKSADTNANSRVADLIKPLLPDLIESESRFELTARGADDADWALALRLPGERVADWNKNLTDLAKAARMQVSAGNNGAWEAARENYRFSFTPRKEGIVLEGGFGDGKRGPRPKVTLGRSSKEVLTAELNLPKIGQMWNAETLQHAPRVDITVTPRKGMLRSEMDIEYPQSLNITPERWNPPVTLINDPLIGFTAIQGISDRLGQSEQFRRLGAQRTPNQAFLWSQSAVPFAISVAADVGNPATIVSNIVSGYLPQFKDKLPGRILVLTNRPGVIWRGLPVAVPFVEAGESGNSPFLVAGLFPITFKDPKPAPPELYAQLKKRNLVYYDWEITGERVKQWRAIWQFARILQGKLAPGTVSERWIDAVMPQLGNTVTQVTLERKNRLKLVRQSESGLSSLELVLLAHALDPNDIADGTRISPGQKPTPPRRSGSPTPPKR